MKTCGTVLCGVALAFLLGCAGSPSDRSLYNIAREGLIASANLPANARIAPFRDAEVHAGKSAASVRLPCEHADSSGQTVKCAYTVWLRNMANRWEFDRCDREGNYPKAAEQAAPAPGLSPAPAQPPPDQPPPAAPGT